MDELAYALKLDPVELRLRNDAAQDPEEEKPWTSKSLRACYLQGAERFGWEKRNPEPGSMKAEDGETLLGWGMASMAYDAKTAPAAAHIRLEADGSVYAESSTCEQGTGSYTIMRQVAADALGVPYAQVTFQLGDTRQPRAPISAGSMTAASVGSAVQAAGHSLRHKLIALALANRDSPLHAHVETEVDVQNGRMFLKADPAVGETYTSLLQRLRLESMEATEQLDPGEAAKEFNTLFVRRTFRRSSDQSTFGRGTGHALCGCIRGRPDS